MYKCRATEDVDVYIGTGKVSFKAGDILEYNEYYYADCCVYYINFSKRLVYCVMEQDYNKFEPI